MKKLLSLLTGMVFVLAFGMAYAYEAYDLESGEGYTSEKMIRDDDLKKYDGKEAGSIEVPAVTDEVRGSAPGGMTDTEPGLKSDKSDDKANSVEKDKTKPGYGGDRGGPEKRWDPLDY